MVIDMELENTVFLIAPVQFSVVRIVMFFIQFSNTVQNTSYFVMYMFFLLLILLDFAKLRNSRRPGRRRSFTQRLNHGHILYKYYKILYTCNYSTFLN